MGYFWNDIPTIYFDNLKAVSFVQQDLHQCSQYLRCLEPSFK